MPITTFPSMPIKDLEKLLTHQKPDRLFREFMGLSLELMTTQLNRFSASTLFYIYRKYLTNKSDNPFNAAILADDRLSSRLGKEVLRHLLHNEREYDLYASFLEKKYSVSTYYKPSPFVNHSNLPVIFFLALRFYPDLLTKFLPEDITHALQDSLFTQDARSIIPKALIDLKILAKLPLTKLKKLLEYFGDIAFNTLGTTKTAASELGKLVNEFDETRGDSKGPFISQLLKIKNSEYLSNRAALLKFISPYEDISPLITHKDLLQSSSTITDLMLASLGNVRVLTALQPHLPAMQAKDIDIDVAMKMTPEQLHALLDDEDAPLDKKFTWVIARGFQIGMEGDIDLLYKALRATKRLKVNDIFWSKTVYIKNLQALANQFSHPPSLIALGDIALAEYQQSNEPHSLHNAIECYQRALEYTSDGEFIMRYIPLQVMQLQEDIRDFESMFTNYIELQRNNRSIKPATKALDLAVSSYFWYPEIKLELPSVEKVNGYRQKKLKESEESLISSLSAIIEKLLKIIDIIENNPNMPVETRKSIEVTPAYLHAHFLLLHLLVSKGDQLHVENRKALMLQVYAGALRYAELSSADPEAKRFIDQLKVMPSGSEFILLADAKHHLDKMFVEKKIPEQKISHQLGIFKSREGGDVQKQSRKFKL